MTQAMTAIGARPIRCGAVYCVEPAFGYVIFDWDVAGWIRTGDRFHVCLDHGSVLLDAICARRRLRRLTLRRRFPRITA